MRHVVSYVLVVGAVLAIGLAVLVTLVGRRKIVDRSGPEYSTGSRLPVAAPVGARGQLAAPGVWAAWLAERQERAPLAIEARQVAMWGPARERARGPALPAAVVEPVPVETAWLREIRPSMRQSSATGWPMVDIDLGSVAR